MKESSQDIKMLNRQTMRVVSNLSLHKNMEAELFFAQANFPIGQHDTMASQRTQYMRSRTSDWFSE